MIIRKATTADLRDILTLVQELAVYEKEPDAVTATLDVYIENFEQGVFDAFVAIVDGEVVGMTLYYMTFSTWKGRMLYLEDFIVRATHRGSGIGRKLFEALVSEARRRACVLIKWQVLDWNTPAIRFYERLGAEIEREWWNGKLALT